MASDWELKQRLIKQMGSKDNTEALQAVEELRERGWLEDGSLSRADLQGADLHKANLSGANLWETGQRPYSLKDWKDFFFTGVNLSQANLGGTNLREASLIGAGLRYANLRGADLSRASLFRANLRYANLSEADLRRANLSGADLSRALLIIANLSGADLSGANLSGAGPSGADLSGADLSGADLNGAILIKANLRKANLERADLSEAVLIGAVLEEAYLYRANLSEADLSDANLTEARCGRTVFADVDLSTVKELETVQHRFPSTIGIDTLYRSKGQIPDVFLRGCGVPDEMITYARSLVGKPIEFFSCFISYAHEDKSFARRVHDTLQGRGIRCWLDEHQIKPGQKIWAEVDRGIRLWDKVILCASQHSLTSWWVDDELEKAFAKERKLLEEEGREVLALIPLNLDGYLFSEEYDSHKKEQITSRYAPSFVGWEKDHALFERQIEQVIEALRTDEGREVPPESKL